MEATQKNHQDTDPSVDDAVATYTLNPGSDQEVEPDDEQTFTHRFTRECDVVGVTPSSRTRLVRLRLNGKVHEADEGGSLDLAAFLPQHVAVGSYMSVAYVNEDVAARELGALLRVTGETGSVVQLPRVSFSTVAGGSAPSAVVPTAPRGASTDRSTDRTDRTDRTGRTDSADGEGGSKKKTVERADGILANSLALGQAPSKRQAAVVARSAPRGRPIPPPRRTRRSPREPLTLPAASAPLTGPLIGARLVVMSVGYAEGLRSLLEGAAVPDGIRYGLGRDLSDALERSVDSEASPDEVSFLLSAADLDRLAEAVALRQERLLEDAEAFVEVLSRVLAPEATAAAEDEDGQDSGAEEETPEDATAADGEEAAAEPAEG